MKDLLRKIFKGVILHQESWDGDDFLKSEEYAMIEACGGDLMEGSLLYLFNHWGNDIQSIAPYYGLALQQDDNGKLFINEDVPPPPSLLHWWDNGSWQKPEDTNGIELDAISKED